MLTPILPLSPITTAEERKGLIDADLRAGDKAREDLGEPIQGNEVEGESQVSTGRQVSVHDINP